MISTYIVQEGEQIGNIARKFGVSIEDIIRVNNFDQGQNLTVGQTINIPVKQNTKLKFYQVKKGDTLYQIAGVHGTTAELLAEVNGLKTYDYLHPGQIILVPDEGYKLYITKLGDTIQNLAVNKNTSIQSIIDDNKSIYLLPDQLLVYRE